MYEVIRPLATGHQGAVELARAPDGRLVALKRLAVEGPPAEREIARRRLRREAELLRSLRVEGVIELLDVVEEGEGADAELVLVMPYLPGGSLHDRVSRAGPLPAARLAELAVPLLRAVAGLHRRGVLHRDIKPGNVLFDAAEGGRPHLIDLGIGTRRDLTAGLSAAHQLLGTPAFIAPERARGEAATAASDIYSLGAILRFAITGMPPHGVGDVVSIVGRASAGRVEPLPPGTPSHVVELLDRMCALEPEHRPSAADLLPGPEGTLVWSPPTTAAREHGDDRTARRRRRRRRMAASLASVALLLTGVAVGVLAADRIGGADGSTDAAADTLADRAELPVEAPAPTTTTTTTCEPLPYQGCDDETPAPGTDGSACLDGRFDHDGDPANGCEAVPDDVDEAELRRGSIDGTIVPEGDVDKVLVPLADNWQLFCDSRFTLALTAPEGLDLEMQVYDDGERIATVEALRGETVSARMSEPSCARNDSTTLEVVIRAVAGRSAEPWSLERSGSW